MSEGQEGVYRCRSREEALALVSEYESSGLSRKAFCASRGLAVATLDMYRKRTRQEEVRPQLLAMELAAAPNSAVTGSMGMAVVLRNGRRIEIGQHVDAALLTELIGIVERA
jgi:hypothetical protein